MKKEEIILVGGGGHCKSCIDVIEQEGRFSIAGIVDMPEKLGEKILDYEILWTDDDLPELAKKYSNYLITVGHIKSNKTRIKLFTILNKLKVNFPIIISPRSYVSEHSEIYKGTIIMNDAIVNANAKIGVNCIINTKALVEHDVIIGNHCHISTNATVNGQCVVGNNCFIGSNSVIANNINIISDVLVGAGAVVTKDINKKGVYLENPAKRIK